MLLNVLEKMKKFKSFMSEFSQLRCGLCSLRFAADKYIVKKNKIKKENQDVNWTPKILLNLFKATVSAMTLKQLS